MAQKNVKTLFASWICRGTRIDRQVRKYVYTLTGRRRNGIQDGGDIGEFLRSNVWIFGTVFLAAFAYESGPHPYINAALVPEKVIYTASFLIVIVTDIHFMLRNYLAKHVR